jgi:hypothetical protein
MPVNIISQQTTTINNVLLPTFIDVNPTSQDPGQPITVSGQTVPGGLVDMSIESPVQSINLTADASGNWTTELIADFGPLPVGQYDAYATVTFNTYQSIQSRKVSFEVKQIPFTTKLTVNGYGPPGAFLSFKDGADVIGSGLVNPDGTFSQTLTFPDADKTVDLGIAADNGSQITPVTTRSVNIVAFTTTTVDNILLPTFIDVTPVTANVGAPITVSGNGTPTAVATLTIASPTKTTTITLDASGDWSKELIATFGALPQGSYTAQATLTMGSMTSIASRVVNFQVMETQTATKLKVDGFTAPNAFLTFTENSAVVGTVVAKADGTFEQTLQFPDVTMTRTVSIVADNGSQQTPTTTFTATLNAFNETDVANLVLPTFIDVTPLKVPFGTTVTALGMSTPGSLVRLFIQSPLASSDLTAGSDGKWQGDLNALFGQLQKGTYTAYARVYVNGSYQSNLSRQISFDVIDSDQCADRRSDLNCDGKVDITDVGILIYYWGTTSAGQKADINKDGVVDVSDVGIMVYDWTY